MRMGSLIARFPFERTAISPRARTARLDCRADAGQLPQTISRAQHSPSQEAGPRVAIPSRRPRKAAMVTFKIGRRPLGLSS